MANATRPIATLNDADLLDLLRAHRTIEDTDRAKDDMLELDSIEDEIADRIVAYIELECNEASASIVNGFRASATWHQEPDAWSETNSPTLCEAAKDYAHRELQNYLDQKVGTEIKATGSGRRDTMSRVINPPDNGL